MTVRVRSDQSWAQNEKQSLSTPVERQEHSARTCTNYKKKSTTNPPRKACKRQFYPSISQH